MEASTLRVRINRKTGEVISKEVFDPFDISKDEYSERLVKALTGKSSEDAARVIRDEVYGCLNHEKAIS